MTSSVTNFSIAVAVGAVSLFVPLAARADVAPVPTGCGGSSYDSCSVTDLEQPGTSCLSCLASESNPCASEYEGTGFVYACTGDSSGDAWSEIWCDGPPRDILVPDSAGACAGTQRGLFSSLTGIAGLATLGLLLAGLRRRRLR